MTKNKVINFVNKLNESHYNSVGRGCSEVYSALAEVCEDFYFDEGEGLTREEMENAIAYFLDKYYEDEYYNEDEYDEE